MKDFFRSGLNYRHVLLPMLVAIFLVAGVYLFTEQRRNEIMQSVEAIRAGEERVSLLAEVSYVAADAESAQRGFLLTQDQQYLEPFQKARTHLAELLPKLSVDYQDNSALSASFIKVRTLLEKKFAELESSIDAAPGSSEAALHMVKSNIDLHWMQQVRTEIETMRDLEQQHIHEKIREWQRLHKVSRYIAGASALLNILLLLLTGLYIKGDIERRDQAALRLDREVTARTAELNELSLHLQRVTEREKSHLARELHDELGGLLVAIKMDLAQLGKKFDFQQADVYDRWQRIQSAITAGVALKRRVIEELRPTLLDNMGLVAALRWQAEEVCGQAGIELVTDLPNTEPPLDTNISIAIFRVAQEALTNIVKHAHASRVKLSVQVSDEELTMILEDNGVGAKGLVAKQGSHGILSMKYRIQSIGGSFHLGSADPGTRVVLRLPLEIAKAMASLD